MRIPLSGVGGEWTSFSLGKNGFRDVAGRFGTSQSQNWREIIGVSGSGPVAQLDRAAVS